MIHSAGIAIIDFFDSRSPKVLCLRSFGLWDFPKGRLENQEDLLSAAKRETEEECGLTPDDFQFLEQSPVTITYRVSKDTKEATYFFAKRTSQKIPTLPINPGLGRAEHDEWRWIDVKDLYVQMPRRLIPVLESILKVSRSEELE